MKVLSLFDGISCGMAALERAGIPVERYAAYEIDKLNIVEMFLTAILRSTRALICLLVVLRVHTGASQKVIEKQPQTAKVSGFLWSTSEP